jgi:hypothetical protein
MRDHPAGTVNSELLEVLDRAAARTDAGPDAFNVPDHVRCAQAMLEMAVEWRLPAVERWAVAWLAAAGGMQLRMRWSSRSRDGRFRREAQASHRIVSITGDEGRVVLGLSSGAVESWAEDGTLQRLTSLAGSPVWVVAARGDWLVAAGPGNACQTRGWVAAPPAIPQPRAGLKTAAISSDGQIAVGAEGGYLRTWAPGRSWDKIEVSDIALPARAIAFASPGSGLIRAVWESGEVRELDRGTGAWRALYRFPDKVRAAAWTRAGTMLAAATGQEVWLVSPGESGPAAARRLWTQPGVGAVAWSPDDFLASASQDQVYASTGPVGPSGVAAYKSITTDELIEAIAMPDSGHVVTVQDNELVQWELGSAGSDDPTFFAGDRITALGIHPQNRRVTLVGTERGRLREYSATGAISSDARLPDGPKVTQIGWQSGTGGWLVASMDGLFQFRPGEEPRLVVRGLFQHVAVGGGRVIYATGRHVRTSDEKTFTLPEPVADLHADRNGTFAAIDEDGHVLVQRPGEEASEGPNQEEGTRLLGNDGDWLLLQDYEGRISSVAPWGSRSFGTHPANLLTAARFDQGRIVIAYEDEGILLARSGLPASSWVPDRVRAMTVSAGRIAVATPNHLAGYDVLDAGDGPGAGGEDADGSIPLRARSEDDGYEILLPTGAAIALAGEEVRRAARAMLGDREERPTTVRELSEAVYQAGRLGDLLWQGGLDLVIDRARGPDPNRPVRLEWHCPADDAQADRFPWELLHPSVAPLGWFDTPEITSVRMVASATPPAGHHGFASGDTPTMLVVRGTADGMDAVDDAFDRFRRRSRRTDLRLLTAKPLAVGSRGHLAGALARPADIVQLWAHSGDSGVRLTDDPEYIPTDEVADLLAGPPPRLVVLVGCRSGALGRALVKRGVLAVVAMRVPVYDHTVQPLVEDFTAVVLSGHRVDLAFAGALRRYLLTGQPGAAAVPMLYLAAGADSTLFPRP